MCDVNKNLFKMIGNSILDESESLKIYFFNFYKGFPKTYEYVCKQ